MGEEIIMRPAVREDMKYVMEMIQELAECEETPNGTILTAEILQRDGFDSSPSLFSCFVTESKDVSTTRFVGYTIFFNIYSTWEGKSLMMQDLYVRPDYRKKGIGKKIIEAVVKHALDTGCCRVDFHVLKWNPAREFYEHLGAVDFTTKEEWLMYRFDKDAMNTIIKNL